MAVDLQPSTNNLQFKQKSAVNFRGENMGKIDYRKEAKGRECMVRLPGICNFNPETTVLAHYRMDDGGGQKPNDKRGAWACSACHDECDRRTRKLGNEFVRLAHAEGVFRTQDVLISEGKL